MYFVIAIAMYREKPGSGTGREAGLCHAQVPRAAWWRKAANTFIMHRNRHTG